MGVQLADLFPGRPISFGELSGRRISVDAHNALHQFLAIIRQHDGEPLRDSKGRITSVYSGLFYRTARMMAEGVRPVYVFDGPPPRFKKRVIGERREVREKAMVRWQEARREGDMRRARKYAQSALNLTPEMIENSRDLLSRMGLPYVLAPSEGEAQAAAMALRGDVWAASSQDFDSLLFGSPRLVRNMTITGRRKLPNKDVYVNIEPTVIELYEVMQDLGIDQEQLITLGLLVGTDYNQGGIRGIGAKKGLELVKKSGDLDSAMSKVDWDFDVDWREIHGFFTSPPHSDDYGITFRPPDSRAVKDLLCGEFDFSEDRVQKALDQIAKSPKGKQMDLSGWA